MALLTAVSIFVAIFSLFTISHEYMERKKLQLFENGKLAYYFSVDKLIAELGVCAILISIFVNLIIGESSSRFLEIKNSPIKWVLLLSINLSFFFTFIVLRSIIEFYIHRPAMYIMGDLKRESLEDFNWK